MDPYKHLNLERNPDGSLTRRPLPVLPAKGVEDGPNTPAVPFKDVPLNPAHKTWLRIYLPDLTHHHQNQKLPILLYIHGGGFIILSASDPLFHNSCSKMASQLPALVLSLEYRLSPENPLPAAYDDAVDAILWLRQQAAAAASEADSWLRNHGDFSRCFLMGCSAGANIAYYAALRALALDLEPLQVAGLIFDQPFFGGEQRMESELRLAEQGALPLPVTDLMWELSLPTGSNRDHEFCNPMLHHCLQEEEEKRLPRCLVRGHVGDSLIDWQREFAKMLEKRAVSVVAHLESEGFHGIEVIDPSKADILQADVKRFIYPSISHEL